MKYTAFGEIRSENGVSPTDYHEPKLRFGFKVKAVPAFTHIHGQRYEIELGLSYYVARWYDGELGHFISADTIIPQPGNALDWDRYAYVLWNPMRYTDPSGHWIDPFDPNMPGTPDSRPNTEIIVYNARKIAISVAVDTEDVVEGWAAASDYVADNTDSVGSYMSLMDRIFGHQGSGLPSEKTSRECFFCGILDEDGRIDFNNGPTPAYSDYVSFGDNAFNSSSGFLPRFQYPDSQNNQVQHTYYYVQLGYYHGYPTAVTGNLAHELINGIDLTGTLSGNIGAFVSAMFTKGDGESVQDFFAGQAGANMGYLLYRGYLPPARMPPRALAGWHGMKAPVNGMGKILKHTSADGITMMCGRL